MTFRSLPCFAAITAFCFLPVPAQAGFYSGNELLGLCTAERADSTYFDKTYECVAYIAGAVDSFNDTRAVNKLKRCIPRKVTISQLKDVTVDYLRANPTDRKNSASTLVFAATRKAWPCAKTK
jgi:hypothetical protein